MKRLINDSVQKKGVSLRKLASKYKISKSYVHKAIQENNVNYRKRKLCPRYTPGQAERAKTTTSALCRDFFPASGSTAIVTDDESYFPLKDDRINGKKGFYISPETAFGDVPDEIRLKPKSKYPEKLLVWIAISESGISRPFFLVKRLRLLAKYTERSV